MSDESDEKEPEPVEIGNQDSVNAEEAAEMLGMHVETFLSLPEGRIPRVAARTLPQTKELGLPPQDSPQNEEFFLVEDVQRYKRELEEEKDQSKQDSEPPTEE